MGNKRADRRIKMVEGGLTRQQVDLIHVCIYILRGKVEEGQSDFPLKSWEETVSNQAIDVNVLANERSLTTKVFLE